MRALVSLALALVCSAGSLFAQDWAKPRLEKSPRHLEWITVKSGTRDVKCFIAFPEVKERATAVLVIHEIFGLSDWVRGMTDQFAEAGYIAIAPDLLSGMGPGGGGTAEFPDVDSVRKAISSLPPDQVTADLNAVAAYVSKLPAANAKIAAAGFCWGGSQTFRYATNNPMISAGFVFYGTAPEKPEELARISAPVFGFYGGNDARVNATVPASAELMTKAGKKYDPVTYEGAGHGFMRAGEAPDATEPNKKARDAAWEKLKGILQKL